jgi:hypothetical protein
VTIPGSAELARRGIAEIAGAIAAGRAAAAEKACWRLIDEIAELVARRFRDRRPSRGIERKEPNGNAGRRNEG